MPDDSKAIDLARGLLGAGERYAREGNVAGDLALLLDRIGIDPAEVEREHPSGGGRIDVYLPRGAATLRGSSGSAQSVWISG